MRALLPYLALSGFLAAVMLSFALLARRIRRRGTAGGGLSGALAAYEEAFRTTSHAAHYEIRAQADRRTPTGSPDPLRRRRRRL
ncbi:hypothetical protein LXH13_07900 [Streptomyces spinosirectus]|jgi:hypothetical protein|uniref:hypothetical protein n=1 Tax=Streptomyces TaxID=1883 RepID=UPI000D351531|nr:MULTISPECIES: hypothetical protein [Streptomyces]MBY8344222.1 hypothetical protein [Streptomyces plumbidurans]PTM94674.1 hypothetical protein C7821_106215 [Streptomyces sp. VMFN-G11Ma]UIR16960.1 hypothetical protein LXH13_07900 [Streptomyces spinosirectus]